MRKRLLILGLALVIVAGCSIISFASSYTSTMSISGNSTLKGATRTYVGSTHKIEILLSAMNVPGEKSNYCNINLDQEKLSGDKVINSSKKNFVNVGTTYSMTSKNVPDGKFYYFFNNKQIGSGFSSRNTTMSSY